MSFFSQIILSKERTDENFAVILIRATNPSVEYFDIASLFKAYFMTVDTLILEDPYCEGLILVFDVAGSSVSHLRKLNFGVLRKCIKYLEVLIFIIFISVPFIPTQWALFNFSHESFFQLGIVAKVL